MSTNAQRDPTPNATPRFAGQRVITDGNKAISRVAYKTNGGIVIYTITPSSPFGEESAYRASRKQKNIYGAVPEVFMACDEAAAASFIQGIGAKGVGAATCSSSQGILLMIPEMYNSAGQLLPISFYIGARDLSRHSLTIFAGHSDVYAVRDTGILILFAKDAQELQDIGAIGERLKWEVSLPIAVVYDGFLTTHKQTQILELSDEFFWEFMPHDKMIEHKARSLDSAHPTVWGTNENPDGYMQAGLAQKPHALAVSDVLPKLMAEFEELTGRRYTPYEYHGHPEATDVIIAAGSSLSTLRGTVDYLLREQPDRKIGVVGVRAFRPFLIEEFIKTLPTSVERIAVLDRSMTHTAQDEPLCADVRAAVMKSVQGFDGVPRLERLPVVTGGIYGLSGKDFHPGSVVEVYNHLEEINKTGKLWTGFSVGVIDDVMHASLPQVPAPNIFAGAKVRQARIVAFGSDGTVSMVKAAADVYSEEISPETGKPFYIGSHAEYDSKKAGGVTVSSFRCSPEPFEECFDVRNPDYVAVHHPALLFKRDGILDGVAEGGTLVVNTPQDPAKVFASLPGEMQQAIVDKKLEVFSIDAFKIAAEEGLGGKISMIMQRVLYDRFGLITAERANEVMEEGIRAAFSKKGEHIVEMNIRAFHRAVESLHPVPVGEARSGGPLVSDEPVSDLARKAADGKVHLPVVPPPQEEGFRREIQGPGLAGRGNEVSVGSYYRYARGGSRPANTWKGLQRSFATELPTFLPELCNECGSCVYNCPTGGALEQSILDDSMQEALEDVPLGRVFRNSNALGPHLDTTGHSLFHSPWLMRRPAYGLAVDPNLCTGCGICAEVCEQDAIKLEPATSEIYSWLSERRRILDKSFDVGGGTDPNFDFTQKRHTKAEMETIPNYVGTSGACAGCYEPLYVSKFLQLYPYTVIANATGCSSIWGAQAYESPYGTDEQGYGAAWMNPLFENNAAVGGGMALGTAAEKQQMNVSGQFVLEALSKDPELAKIDVVRKLGAQMEVLHRRSLSGEAHTLAERVEQVAFVDEVKKTVDEVAKLAAFQKNRELRTHVGFLRSTITNVLDKTTLIVGGDGWAFDIGLQMMIHVLQSNLDVVVMVLVTDVYSNTGGQMSKATPKGMDAPFAPGGKELERFPLGLSVANGQNAFVANVNMAYPNHMLAAYHRAAEYKGPSLLLCYVPCMTAQKFANSAVPHQARRATTTRYWPLYTYDPETDVWSLEGNPESYREVAKSEGDFIADFCRHEGRFRSQFKKDGTPSELLLSQRDQNLRIWRQLQKAAGVKVRG